MSGGRELMPCGVVIVKPASSHSSINDTKESKRDGRDKAAKDSNVEKESSTARDRFFVNHSSSRNFLKKNFPSRNMSGSKMKSRKKGWRGDYGGLGGEGNRAGVKTSASCNSLSPYSALTDDVCDDERHKLISGHRFSSSTSFFSALSKLSPGRASLFLFMTTFLTDLRLLIHNQNFI